MGMGKVCYGYGKEVVAKATDCDSHGVVSGSATRTIRTQQGLSQHELTLPEDDAVIYMLLLKRNGIWFADVTK